MSTIQTEIQINTTGRKTYEITHLINTELQAHEIKTGLCHVFIQHTSASLIITENADPDVHTDLETIIQRLSPDGDPEYLHTQEGPDDMSAHGRSILTQTEITLPIRNNSLSLGIWQGIYLWEHRTHPMKRNIVITMIN